MLGIKRRPSQWLMHGPRVHGEVRQPPLVRAGTKLVNQLLDAGTQLSVGSERGYQSGSATVAGTSGGPVEPLVHRAMPPEHIGELERGLDDERMGDADAELGPGLVWRVWLDLVVYVFLEIGHERLYLPERVEETGGGGDDFAEQAEAERDDLRLPAFRTVLLDETIRWYKTVASLPRESANIRDLVEMAVRLDPELAEFLFGSEFGSAQLGGQLRLEEREDQGS
jgi:hypothetical protein